MFRNKQAVDFNTKLPYEMNYRNHALPNYYQKSDDNNDDDDNIDDDSELSPHINNKYNDGEYFYNSHHHHDRRRRRHHPYLQFHTKGKKSKSRLNKTRHNTKDFYNRLLSAAPTKEKKIEKNLITKYNTKDFYRRLLCSKEKNQEIHLDDDDDDNNNSNGGNNHDTDGDNNNFSESNNFDGGEEFYRHLLSNKEMKQEIRLDDNDRNGYNNEIRLDDNDRNGYNNENDVFIDNEEFYHHIPNRPQNDERTISVIYDSEDDNNIKASPKNKNNNNNSTTTTTALNRRRRRSSSSSSSINIMNKRMRFNEQQQQHKSLSHIIKNYKILEMKCKRNRKLLKSYLNIISTTKIDELDIILGFIEHIRLLLDNSKEYNKKIKKANKNIKT